MSPSDDGISTRYIPGRRRALWAAVVVASLLLGVGVGWLYTDPSWLGRLARANWLTRMLEIVFVLGMTLQSTEVIRVGRESQLWYASMGMLPLALVTCSRAVASAQGLPQLAGSAIVSALWLTVSFACDRRWRWLALRCAWLCGGVAATVVFTT